MTTDITLFPISKQPLISLKFKNSKNNYRPCFKGENHLYLKYILTLKKTRLMESCTKVSTQFMVGSKFITFNIRLCIREKSPTSLANEIWFACLAFYFIYFKGEWYVVCLFKCQPLERWPENWVINFLDPKTYFNIFSLEKTNKHPKSLKNSFSTSKYLSINQYNETKL